MLARISRRLLPRSRQSARHISNATRTSYLKQLAHNPELDAEDARAELRWMMQANRPSELSTMVERRAKGEPLQYILGTTDFGPLMLKCRPPTLIPRPETAEVFGRLAQLLANRIPSERRALSIVDLCTGSGCIPLLLKRGLGANVRVHGYDLSSDAIQLAQDNILDTGLDIEVRQADIFEPDFVSRVLNDAGGRVDLVVSNPPYITAEEYRDLPLSVRDYEDPAALLGDRTTGNKGLAFYERIAELLPHLLTNKMELGTARWSDSPIPLVAVEIGSEQAADVQDIFHSAGMGRVEAWDDQYNRPRMVLGWAQ